MYCDADYEWHQVVQLPPEQTPKKAIDAFLNIFIEVADRMWPCIRDDSLDTCCNAGMLVAV